MSMKTGFGCMSCRFSSFCFWVWGFVWLTGCCRYHHLNHHAIFGAGYRSGAVSIMQRLIVKYGQ